LQRRALLCSVLNQSVVTEQHYLRLVYSTMQGAAELDPEDVGKNREKALALGSALLVCMAVPWALCVILYSGVTYSVHFPACDNPTFRP